MFDFGLLFLGPFFVDLVLIFIIVTAKTKNRLRIVVCIYIILNIIAPITYGIYKFEKVTYDWMEFASLIGLVTMTRLIDLFGFKGWQLFKEMWQKI